MRRPFNTKFESTVGIMYLLRMLEITKQEFDLHSTYRFLNRSDLYGN